MSFLTFENSNSFYDILSSNRSELSPIYLRTNIIDKYAILIAYFPFNEKQEKIYKKLSPIKKAGYLSLYLIKCAKNIKISDTLINEYYLYHKICFKHKKNFYDTSFKNGVVKDFTNSDYKSIKNAYDFYKDREESFLNYNLLFRLLIEITIKTASEKNKRQLKIEEIFNINE